jgi:hypothetical protein
MTDIAQNLNNTLAEIVNAKVSLEFSSYQPASILALRAAGLDFHNIEAVATQDNEFSEMFIKQNYDSNQLNSLGFNICGSKLDDYEALSDSEKLNIKRTELAVLNSIIRTFTFTPILPIMSGDERLTFNEAVILRNLEIRSMTLKSTTIYNLFHKLKK